ncbi:MAG: 3-isopropylmalate dehydrogenase [Candidatus Eisenbacteria bacterium]
MRRHRIGYLPGDGIGPEVLAQARRVLDEAARLGAFQLDWEDLPYGSEHYLATGETLPAEALERMRGMDAILFGAIGDPRIERGMLERAIVSGIRFGLDLYVNLRPVRLYAEALCPLKDKGREQVDLVVVRENTEDLYAGIGGFFRKGTPEEVAVQEMILTRRGADRILRFAFEQARRRPRKRLVLVDKANAIAAFDLWRRAYEEIGAEYPDVRRETLYVDAAAMRLVREPEWFDTVVTSNVFGDILTDLGAALSGGMGLAASANLHPGRVSMFEPIHGSAPDIAGKGVANPLAAILAGAMLLEHVGEARAAATVEAAAASCLSDGTIRTGGANSGFSTGGIGDLVLGRLAACSGA